MGVIQITVESSMMGKHFSKRAFQAEIFWMQFTIKLQTNEGNVMK